MEAVKNLQKFSELAIEKIAAELKEFKGDNKATAVSTFTAATLTHFCKENECFAEAVYKAAGTLSDCCAQVMKGCKSSISDIDVYRGAVKYYLPDADVFFKMEIITSQAKPQKQQHVGFSVSLDDLL